MIAPNVDDQYLYFVMFYSKTNSDFAVCIPYAINSWLGKDLEQPALSKLNKLCDILDHQTILWLSWSNIKARKL